MASRRTDDPTAGPGASVPTGRLRGADAFRLHLTLGIGLGVCAAAFVFEVSRALGGNTLSWAYVFEWPIFAAFAVYMWWNLLHGQDGSRQPAAPVRAGDRSEGTDVGTPAGTPADAPADDADLRAWQDYLRALEADDARMEGRGTD